jgi:soluble lytic murein transglycosylase-like protein
MERISSYKNYPVPAMKASFYTNAQVETNVKPIIAKIKGSNYISILRRYAKKMNIPENVLIAFYGVESSGNDKVGMNSAGAIGLGQVTRPTAYDAIKKEIQDGYMTDDEKAYVKRKVPALGKKNFEIKYGDFEGVGPYSKNTAVQNQLLTALRDDTEFNIFISSMILAQLAERYRDRNGMPLLHQVIAHYNGGRRYGDVSKKYPNAWDAVKASDLPSETKNYMKKLVGTNGFLDVLTR